MLFLFFSLLEVAGVDEVAVLCDPVAAPFDPVAALFDPVAVSLVATLWEPPASETKINEN
jgi:hypothetical protein